MYHFLVTLLFLAGTLNAAPLAVYLTWEQDPTSTMTIQWLTADKETQNSVKFRKAEDEEKTCEGVSKKLPDDEPYLVHFATITSLEPDTIYSFELPGESVKRRFRTMPKDLSAPVRFAVGGDVCPNEFAPFEEMCQKVAKENPRFVLLGGDLAYSVSDKKMRKDSFSRWLPFLETWSRSMKDKDGCQIPMLPCIGNHEVLGYFGKTPEAAKFFYTLFKSPGTAGYTSLNFASYLNIIFLDSGHTHSIGGEQTEWLKTALAKSQNQLHRFAIYHVPAFPSVRYFRLHENSSIRRHWVPLFEKHGLHAAFENHDHAYKRTHPLLEGHRDPFGVVYFGDGSWGTKPRIPKKASRTTYLAKTKSRRQYLLVTLSKTERLFQAKTLHDHIIDTYVQKVGQPNPI